jgi:arginine repressor
MFINNQDEVIAKHMFGDNSRSDKVETIKKLIRQNNYKNSNKVYEQCMGFGISVNLTSLTRFIEKLELLDRSDRSKRLERLHLEKSQTPTMMTYEQVKHRETEITFELGELRIKENKLMEELNKISQLLDSKQFN